MVDYEKAAELLISKVDELRTENTKYKDALEEIIIESGDMDINHWPVPQQSCQAIANNALKGE